MRYEVDRGESDNEGGGKGIGELWKKGYKLKKDGEWVSLGKEGTGYWRGRGSRDLVGLNMIG